MFAGGYSDTDSEEDYFFDNFSTSFDKIKKRVINPNTKFISNQKPKEEILETACLNGDLTTVTDFLSSDPQFNLNTVLISKSPLMCAAYQSQSHIVEFLLKNGADPNFHYDSETPLMCACSSPSTRLIANYECVKSLLDKNAIINIGDKFRVTPLMKAVISGKVDVVKLLLTSANIEMQDCSRNTATYYAIDHGKADILKELAERGALGNEVEDKKKLKYLALSKNNPDILFVLGQYSFLQDDCDENEKNVLSTDECWQDLFPGILSKKPAFYFDIPPILHGMKCERLTPLFVEKEIDLATFLAADDKTLLKIGVNFPFERKKILNGLQKFHMRPWNIQTVLGFKATKRIKFMPAECLTDLGSYFRIISVLKSNLEYNENRIHKDNPTIFDSEEVIKLGYNFLDVIKDTKIELYYLKQSLLKINKNNLSPPDLIKPKNPLSAKSFKKTKIIFCIASSVVVCIAFVSLKK